MQHEWGWSQGAHAWARQLTAPIQLPRAPSYGSCHAGLGASACSRPPAARTCQKHLEWPQPSSSSRQAHLSDVPHFVQARHLVAEGFIGAIQRACTISGRTGSGGGWVGHQRVQQQAGRCGCMRKAPLVTATRGIVCKAASFLLNPRGLYQHTASIFQSCLSGRACQPLRGDAGCCAPIDAPRAPPTAAPVATRFMHCWSRSATAAGGVAEDMGWLGGLCLLTPGSRGGSGSGGGSGGGSMWREHMSLPKLASQSLLLPMRAAGGSRRQNLGKRAGAVRRRPDPKLRRALSVANARDQLHDTCE